MQQKVSMAPPGMRCLSSELRCPVHLDLSNRGRPLTWPAFPCLRDSDSFQLNAYRTAWSHKGITLDECLTVSWKSSRKQSCRIMMKRKSETWRFYCLQKVCDCSWERLLISEWNACQTHVEPNKKLLASSCIFWAGIKAGLIINTNTLFYSYLVNGKPTKQLKAKMIRVCPPDHEHIKVS